MFNAPIPPQDDLPTPGELRRSTAIALGVAALLLVTVVLPAEYGVDPTRIGGVLGLTRMGEIKVQLAREAAAADSAAIGVTGASGGGASTSGRTASASGGAAREGSTRADTIPIMLFPDEGREFKLAMEEGATVEFDWSTSAGVVNYDLHGDIVNPPPGFYHGYREGTAQPSDSGTLTAAFDGMHGWFFRNRTQERLTVTLRVRGEYSEVREIR